MAAKAARSRAQGTLSEKAAATKARILAAAVAEFTDKGFSGARVDAIAAAATINKRMLYAYFGNKEDLWLAVLENAYGQKRNEERLLAVERLAPTDAMGMLVSFNLRYVLNHPEFVRILNEENLHHAQFLRNSSLIPALYPPMLTLLDAVLARGVAQGIFRHGIDPLQLYITIMALGHFYVGNQHTLSAIFGQDLTTAQAAIARERHCIDVILHYLRPDCGPGNTLGEAVAGHARRGSRRATSEKAPARTRLET
ncbi:TetR/AcrR family transcriptional regulator [Gluconacetobacter sacchari]|uniref:TetR/AcrR family transcriptional regulator n=1 Tax=Gluconacetobacter sacchari TaxID=92759 RepID=UPI0039B38386